MFYKWGGILPAIVVSVVAGQIELNVTTNSVYRNASKITTHKGFNSETMQNDVALIEVSRNLFLLIWTNKKAHFSQIFFLVTAISVDQQKIARESAFIVYTKVFSITIVYTFDTYIYLR